MRRLITVIFVPADRGGARSVSIPSIVLYITPILCVCLIASAAILAFDHRTRVEEIAELKKLPQADWDPKGAEELRREMESVGERLKRIERLDSELRALVELDIPTEFASAVAPEAQGGPKLEVSEIFDRDIGALRREVDRMIEEAESIDRDLSALLNHFRTRKEVLASMPSIRPIRSFVVSGVGYRKDPFGGPNMEYHQGVDMPAIVGVPVRATADGIVKFAGWQEEYGKVVIIQHEYGYETRYAHCSEIKVRRFQRVKRGDVIALTGNTGRSTGPHLHYEVRLWGKIRNPEDYFLNEGEPIELRGEE
ncbi:MAG: M23 family metallopeptidase [bacterium]